MRLADVLARSTGGKVNWTFSVGDYQGINYMLLEKDGKFMMCEYAYGTCTHCDWMQGVESDWDKEHDYAYPSNYPDSIYDPIIKSMLSDNNWVSKDALIGQLHMVFGVGVNDEEAKNDLLEYLSGLSGTNPAGAD